jgi:UDP-GlcNAc:undecaprenyl-phosphate/decaprenyl-phosphate GlcNAc-1-phosphate transferase
MRAWIFLLSAGSFVLSVVLTYLMIRIAPRLGLIDRPGGRKNHAAAVPLGGGVAIFWAFALPVMLAFLLVPALDVPIEQWDAYRGGFARQVPLLATFLVATLLLHVLGLFDDRRPLGPFVKLSFQFIAAGAVVASFRDVRVLTALGPGVSIALSILWIVAITNAFNFLDNMDGLSAGIAAVATTAFLITTLLIEQWFVAAALALLLGALLGFLCFNFPPARIFMGDSGSLVIGFILGVLTVRTTFLPPGQQWAAGWYAVFAPVIVLAVPLYDLIVVSILRLCRGKSPFVGDTNHFSHRLVARGMSRRTAVLCLYLLTAATSVAAILLPYVQSTFAAMLIFIQTLLVLGVVALLEQHPLRSVSAETEPAEPAR